MWINKESLLRKVYKYFFIDLITKTDIESLLYIRFTQNIKLVKKLRTMDNFVIIYLLQKENL